MLIALYSVIMAVALFNLGIELKRDLMMLQQNSYRNERYCRWMRSSQDSTSVIRLISAVVVMFAFSTFSKESVTMLLILVVAGINVWKLLRAKYKKPLVMTRRAWRIYSMDCVLSLIFIAVILSLMDNSEVSETLFNISVISLTLFFLSHEVTLVANWLLKPVERSINNRYYRDAQRVLAGMPDLKVIGITGSYGKTSTKHYLYRILSEKYDTVMTPGSFNTTLGVVRTVREHLKPYTQVFIVEMGAKQQGDIKEICDLVHPTAAIITAVGEQHLESFKTIENVQRTKFELADSLPSNGFLVINNDFPYIANRHVDNVKVSRYAVNDVDDADYIVSDIQYGVNGSEFTLRTPGCENLRFHTRLVGECNVSNLAAAVIMALYMKVPVEKIRYAVEKIEQVEHRLQLKRTPGGVTILDDAFNSNPHGSAMALDVLASMTGGKRIVITPGMIELGERQEQLNREFGEKIAKSVDVAIIVGKYNRDAIVEGLTEGNLDVTQIRTVDSFAEAQALLHTMLSPGDTVLYENDLPDTFK